MEKKNKIEIVQSEADVLHKKAKELSVEEIRSDKVKKIITDMKAVLNDSYDGVAIAAPQIGIPLRIFIISRKILPKKAGQTSEDLVFINPVIKKLSGKKVTVEEGCLSVRWLYGKMKRSDIAMVEAYNEKGNKFVKTGKGLLAQAFQHETDHLEGKLFIEKAFDIYESKPEEEEKITN